MITHAYGLSVSSSKEAFEVPLEVRKAWQSYVSAVIQHYEIVDEDGSLRRRLKNG